MSILSGAISLRVQVTIVWHVSHLLVCVCVAGVGTQAED